MQRKVEQIRKKRGEEEQLASDSDEDNSTMMNMLYKYIIKYIYT